MLKRMMIISSLCLSISNAFAGAFYVSPAVVYNKIENPDMKFEGLLPRISVGWGDLRMDPVFFAFEAFAEPLKPMTIINDGNVTPEGDQQTLQPDYSYGIDLIPGVNLDTYLRLYSRLGIQNTRFSDLNLTRHGYRLGIGIEWLFNENWSGRVEYTRIAYTSFPTGIGTPVTDEFAASIVYRFVGWFTGGCSSIC